jgi:hypothetical protein
MNSALMLGVVSLATFTVTSLVLAGLVTIAWYAGLNRARLGSADLLALRLFPVVGSLLLVAAVGLPAFVSFEPHQAGETAGPLLLILAMFALSTLCHGIRRGWRAWAAARSVLQRCSPAQCCVVESGHRVQVVDIAEPIIGVIGGWRPRVIAAECVVSACTRDEFLQVVAHEAAHVSARDNLKMLLLLACPDVLSWTPLGVALFERWRTETEFAADQRATGGDRYKRVALASALIKVARLVNTDRSARYPLMMSVAVDDVEGRVRQLLAPAPIASSNFPRALAFIAVFIPVVAIPFYAPVHELIEALVRFGL